MTVTSIDTPYEELLADVLENGTLTTDRTGTGTYSVFGRQIRYNLAEYFPLITTKRVHFKSAALELIWFLNGDSNVKWLQDRGVRIWNEWADEDGELGPVYGVQWRSWPAPNGETIAQISQVMDSLANNPASRRHLVTAWNPGQLDEMALPTCRAIFQSDAQLEKYDPADLSFQLYHRSADMFLGVPFNIAEYSQLTMITAHQIGYYPGQFVWTGGDVHIYSN